MCWRPGRERTPDGAWAQSNARLSLRGRRVSSLRREKKLLSRPSKKFRPATRMTAMVASALCTSMLPVPGSMYAEAGRLPSALSVRIGAQEEVRIVKTAFRNGKERAGRDSIAAVVPL